MASTGRTWRWLPAAMLLACSALACENTTFKGIGGNIVVTCSTAATCEAVDFGEVEVGTTATKTVTVTNVGQGPLQISSPSWDPGANDFSHSDLPGALRSGEEQTFVVSFTPTAMGAHETTLVIGSNATNTSQLRLTVRGVGAGSIGPVLDNNDIDFGNVTAHIAEQRTLRLLNSGNIPMKLASAHLSQTSGEFAIQGAESVLVIGPNTSVAFQVSYTPSNAGDDTASIELGVRRADDDNASPTTLTVQLKGRSVPIIHAAPERVDFGILTLGSQVTRNIVVENLGKGPLSITTAVLRTGTSPAYSVSASAIAGVTVLPGEHTTFTATYEPQPQVMATGDVGGALVQSDDPATPDLFVPFDGACADCAIHADPGCDAAFPRRLWPMAADVGSCTDSTGTSLSTIGPGAQDWLDDSGCGHWREFNVTPGQEVRIATWGDGCDCSECVRWHINYVLKEDTGGGYQTKDQVTRPDQRCTASGVNINDTSTYYAQSNRLRMEALSNGGGTGFYYTVCTH